MIIKKLSIHLIALLLVSFTVNAKTFDLDVIELKNRNAEEIIPLIKPFLDKDGAITARDYKLIVKSTPENLKEIKSLIDELDHQLRQFRITVSLGREEERQVNDVQAELQAQLEKEQLALQAQAGNTESEGDASVGMIVRGNNNTPESTVTARAKIKSTTTKRSRPVHQAVNTLEGQWATIRTGQAVPIVQRTRNPDGTVTQTVQYHSATSGFSVLPRIQPGNRVSLYIRPYQSSLSPEGGGKFDTSSLETKISGALGEWIELGSVNEITSGKQNAILHSTRSRNEHQENIFVKVDLIQ